ncbi:low-affinity phosphate transporter [Raphidocelis subcapitata]|uniref:Low-affinity phosphate transporter n=1 Tax=Raphidocelis subcapitata TaxID=307507 RepID=A0A2V0P5H2_9CHLO|nr:low-affinity phosphate transporter [Raphidocelis subcapitata]|eukprot:GBF95096.1 low-affinity phosphate transporter [Raphidocelis subcapitata]
MKFTHQLKFNAVPEWKEHYINYPLLKKIIYATRAAECQDAYDGVGGDEEAAGPSASGGSLLRSPRTSLSGGSLRAPLLQGVGGLSLSRSGSVGARAGDSEFIKALDQELARIISFYLRKEGELTSAFESLNLQLHSRDGCDAAAPAAGGAGGGGGGAAGFGTAPAAPAAGAVDGAAAAEAGEAAAAAAVPQSQAERQRRAEFQRRTAYWAANDRGVAAERERFRQKLVGLFVQLDGLKKYLEMNHTGFRKILKKHDKETTQHQYKDSYMAIVDAKLPLRSLEGLNRLIERLREMHAAVCCKGNLEKAERELRSELREEVGFERNTVWRDMVAMERRTGAVVLQEPAHGIADESRQEPWLRRHWQPLALCVSGLAFAALLAAPLFEGAPEKRNCLAMLAFVSLLWCTEALPLFVTSMLVPLLVVVLRVLVDRTVEPPVRLEPQQAAPAIFRVMFGQVIMLLLGGFAIAAALSKHFIAKQLAVAILSRVGRRPRDVLLANMLVATFASMWISNVAAPVLCFSLVQPILRTLPPSHPFAKSLVIGIALASNLGGMTSPISSPQNIFAIERMSMDGHPPSWLAWFAVALPVAFAGNVLCWGLILAVYRPGQKIREVRPLKPPEDPLSPTQVYVVVVSLATVALWCCNSLVAGVTGEMGVLAILPLVAFFGFGVLSKDDFNGFLWNVVMLAMGGLALGEAVKSSGLLLTIAQSVGQQLPGPPHDKLLVMGAALMCSGAMGLPVSGFPNMNAVALEDPTGVNYVDTIDFLKVGVPGSVLAYWIIVTVGYGIMRAVGM